MDAGSGALTCFIGELPDELLVNIVVQLRVERGFLADEEAEQQRCGKNAVTVQSLHALALSCRKFNAVTIPFLYQSIIGTSEEVFLPLLFRTLFNKPSFGRYIRYIEFATFNESEVGGLGGSDYNEYNERLARVQWLAPSPDSALDLLLPNIGAASGRDIARPTGSGSHRTHQRLAASSSHALVVMLSMMHNLQDASLPDSSPILNALAFTCFNHDNRLRRLWLTSRAVSSGPECQEYALRILMSNAEECHGHLSHYLRRFLLPKTAWLQLAPPPAMKEISLTVQDVDFIHLNDHLESCATLERFSCRWQWTDRFIPRNSVHLPALHISLQHVCKTLTHLTIDTSESASRVDIDSSIPALGSLRDFKALTYLDVAGLVLWGDDDITEPMPLSLLLPESLEILIIKNEWDDEIEDALHLLSVECAVSLPKLKKLECAWRPAPRSIANYLIEAFRLAAVDLAVDIEDA